MWLFRPVGDPRWDVLLRVSGVVALAGIAGSAYVPALSELSVFLSLTLLANGPYAALLPVAYEPVVMLFARLHPPLLVAALGTLGATAVEIVNYRLFSAAVHSDLAARARSSGLARRVAQRFATRPFATVALCAAAPVPFWIARVAGALLHYPERRFVAATAVGRFPRLLCYAALATVIPLTTGQIVAVAAAITLAFAAWVVARRPRARARG